MSDSVAQDQLRAFIERIERMEEEKKAIADDIREIYAEAKGNGFDVPVLRALIRLRKMDHAEPLKREALLDLYMGALGMQAAPRDDDFDPPGRGTPIREGRASALEMRPPVTTPKASVSGPLGQNSGELVTTPSSPPAHTPPAKTSSAEHEGEDARQPIHESTAAGIDRRDNSTEGNAAPQPLDPAAATTPPAGESLPVDTIQASIPSAAAETSGPEGRPKSAGGARSDNAPQTIPEAPKPLPVDQGHSAAVSITQEQRPAEAKTSDQEPLSSGSGEVQDEYTIHLPANLPEMATTRVDDLGSVQDARKMSTDGHDLTTGPTPGDDGDADPNKSAGVQAPAASAPGVVTMERCPPAPIVYHDFARCFPEKFGLALLAFINDIEANGVREPIVKIGDHILDGRARYNVARRLGIEYPVVQYEGTDPLADMIRWNLTSGRLMTTAEQKAIALRLAKLPGNEHRASEIAEMFGLEVGVAA